MQKIKEFYNHLGLKNKLRFQYIVMVIIPIAVLCMVYYQVTTDKFMNMARANALDVVKKNVELLDYKLKEIEKNAIRINKESTIFNALDMLGKEPESVISDLDSQVNMVLYKYYLEDDIATAYIKTPQYTLGDSAMVVIPNENFYRSSIYNKVVAAGKKGVWIATYNPKEEYGLDFYAEAEEIITYACKLNPYQIDEKVAGSIRYSDKDEKAVLLVHLKTDSVKRIFEKNNTFEDAEYCIYTGDGHIIAHKDEAKEGMQEELPWDAYIGERKSGTLIMEYQGRDVIVAYAVSETTGWFSASVIPVQTMLQELSDVQWKTGIIGVLLVMSLMISATVMSRSFTQPIGRLVESMKKTGKGDFGKMVPLEGSDEMQYLIEQYNHMNREIELLIEENYKSRLRNKESEIMALNLQLNPHFLNNTLNIINLQVLGDGNLEASKMIRALSDMLQYTFRNKKEMALLKEDLAWVRNYVFLMQSRFLGKFDVIYDIETDVELCQIPKLLLQPFIENAIIHGFKNIKQGGLLEIIGKKQNEKLLLIIKDNGCGMSEKELETALSEENTRIGLHNSQKRLQLIYGEDGAIEILTQPGEGCNIRIWCSMKF